jgi:bidirectional [NiFe] hydrogenase diaphorase subunit
MNTKELDHLASETLETQEQPTHTLNVCTATGCLLQHSAALKTALEGEVHRSGANCQVRGTGCMGLCAAGPLVAAEPRGLLFKNVSSKDAAEVLRCMQGESSAKLLCTREQPFFQRQTKIVLENTGKIDPESIDEYIVAGGYKTLQEVLTEMSPPKVVYELVQSGLRGRGGAGYPTGLKWSTVAKTASATKYVICNADEGDLGAFMDRSVLEGDPHRVIEGMVIAAYAVGASYGYIYVRAEYPLVVKRLGIALRDAKRLGFLGSQICNTKFSFDLEVRIGGGAYVCGEETALIASIEGKRGTPRARPPYPAHAGLWNKPTLINNVETFANIVPILREGGAWYASIGTKSSKGTKVFSLSGDVRNVGVIEVPMGITLREIIFEIGGGVPEGHKFKAVQTGGPSGGCIPEQFLDLPVDYESLKEVGSMMGSGGMVVMDDSACMVNLARHFMEFSMSESCGKCIPCRAGTAQMYGLLTRMIDGSATMRDLELLEDLADMVSNTSLCGLGQAAPNPVRSTLRYFRDEYIEHIEQKKCRACVCKCAALTEVYL